MNPGQRIAILAAAVVVLVAGFVLAGGSGDDEPRPSEPAQTVAADTAPSASTAPREPESPAPEPPAPRVETIRIRDRAPVGEPPTLEYSSGDTIRLRFRSDVAEQVHIHGYDEYVDVPANGTRTARFPAELEGIFEVESHGSGELLAKLQVSP